MAKIEPLKKITTKTVHGKIDPKTDVPKEGEEATQIMTLVGRIVSAQNKETTFGPYVEFKGSFEAVDAKSGKRFYSSKCLLPEVAQDLIAAPFIADNPPANLDFAFQIGVRWSDSPIGYEFSCNPLVEVESESDPLKEIKSKVSGFLEGPQNEKKTAS